MPIVQVDKFRIATINYGCKEKHWPHLTQQIMKQFGDQEIKNPELVLQILKECFNHFCESFRGLLKANTKASFFIFVQDIHEDSAEIWANQLNGPKLSIDQEEFAGVRRILKCILEQGCKLDLKGHSNFAEEIKQEFETYSNHLDELLYTGIKAFEFCELIARSQICPRAIGTRLEEGELVILTYAPFNSIFEYIFKDYPKHSSHVAIDNCVPQLRQTIQQELNIEYNFLGGFVADQLKNPAYRLGVFPMKKVYDTLINKYGYPKDFVEYFYAGLTLSRSNVMSFEDTLLRTQDKNRYSFRPILEYTIDNKPYSLVGAHKWIEAFMMVTTNCFPFGQFPDEWKAIPVLARFIKSISDNHDKVLEDPAIEILKAKNIKYDRNIKHLKKPNNQNVSLIQQGVGELDIIFLDEIGKVIYLVECKHNRARFEYNNWKRDLANFRGGYEKQLENKAQWLEGRISDILEHFEVLYKCQLVEKAKYQICPLFLINAPTLYMYDSDYVVFTLYDLDRFLNQEHATVEFNGELHGRKYKISRPYFKNAERALADIENN